MRYTFTQPKTKTTEADYIAYLRMACTNTLSWKDVKSRRIGAGMTFQALKEVGLVSYENSSFSITEKGHLYLTYVNSVHVPNQVILRTILQS